MIRGCDVWQKQYLDEMKVRCIGNKKIFTYENTDNNFYEMLHNTVNKNPQKIAFIDNWGRNYTYCTFLEMVDEFAGYLQNVYHISKGTHVGIMLHTSIEYCVSFFAICKLGAVACPFPTKYRKPEVRMLIEKADLALLVSTQKYSGWADDYKFPVLYSVDEEHGYGFRHLPRANYCMSEANAGLDDEVIIMFTSGTTSASKGVVLKNYNILHAVMTYQRLLHITPQDKTIIPVPIYHITGLIALLGLFVYAGGTVFLYRHYDAEKILECIVQHNITFMHGSPTVFGMLLDFRDRYPDLPSIRCLACGSSYTPVEKMRQIHDWMPNMQFVTVYGMTETSSPGTVFPYDAATSIYPESSGKPIPGMDLKIVDEMGNEVEEGEVGSVLIRGANVTEYYYNYKTDLIKEDGWLDTGDMAYFNKESYVFFVDRKKDMINRGGEKIWCIDVEEAIMSIQGVKDVAVVGVPNKKYGEVSAAAVVSTNTVVLNADIIKEALKTKLARYKIPEKFLFVESIPKTPGLKIDKKLIRKMFEETFHD